MLMQSGLEQLGGNFSNVRRVGLPANISCSIVKLMEYITAMQLTWLLMISCQVMVKIHSDPDSLWQSSNLQHLTIDHIDYVNVVYMIKDMIYDLTLCRIQYWRGAARTNFSAAESRNRYHMHTTWLSSCHDVWECTLFRIHVGGDQPPPARVVPIWAQY